MSQARWLRGAWWPMNTKILLPISTRDPLTVQGAMEMKETASALRQALVCRIEVGTPEFQKISVKCGGNGSARKDGQGLRGRQGWEYHKELLIRSGLSRMTAGLPGKQGKIGVWAGGMANTASHRREPWRLGLLGWKVRKRSGRRLASTS